MAIRRPAVTDLTENDNSRVDLSLPVVAGQQQKNAIDPVFDQPGAAFVLLPAGGKFPPLEKAWQERPHSYIEAEQHVAAGGNIGVVAGNGLVGLDQDVPEAFAGLELPATTKWETRPGRLGLWFVARGNIAATMEGIGKKPDAAQLKLYRDGEHVGELKLQRAYQVVPPSWKTVDGQRIDYRLIDGRPPAEVDIGVLVASLQKAGISFSEKGDHKARFAANAARLEQIGREDRMRRYGRAALEAEASEVARSPEGGRNDKLNKAAFSVGQLVASGALSESEAIQELAAAANHAGLEPDEIEKTLRSGLEAGLREPRAIPEAGHKLEGLPERLKENPRLLKSEEVLSLLSTTKRDDPIEFDLLIKSLNAVGIKRPSVEAAIAKYEQNHEQEELSGTGSDVMEKARAIAEKGDPLKYLVWQAQRNHLGDIDYQKVLLLSIASAASETSHGIQPGGSGDKGSGKSDACEAVYHLIPKDRRLDGSLSPMSLFYLQETGRLKPGMVLFSDDVEYGPIIPIYKRSTGKFQRPSNHFTVSSGKDRRSLELTMPERVVWWLTSVESVADEQAFDRQYPISTDSRPEHKLRVAREISDRRARKEKLLVEDEGVKVARAIIADMFDHGPFKVVIPQATRAKWLKTSDFRGQEQYWDLVDALAILRWRQHRMDDDGWLVAEDSDLVEAKTLMMAHKVAHFADLTEAEVKIVGVLSSGLPMTQQELTEKLGVAQSTLSERLKAIMAKSAIITEDADRGRKTYRLNPSMDLNTTYWQGVDLIDLGIDDCGRYRSQQIALSVCYRYVIGIPIGIVINNSNRIPSSLSVKTDNVCGERERGSCEGCHVAKLLNSTPPLSLPSRECPKSTDNDRKEQQATSKDTDKPPISGPISTDNASSGPTDIPIRQSGDAVDGQDAAQKEHFAEEAEAVAGTGHPAGGPEEPVEKPPAAVMTPIDYEKAAGKEWVALVRFNTDYKTDLGGTMCVFADGDETVVSLDRAITWKLRGTAAILWVDAIPGEAGA